MLNCAACCDWDLVAFVSVGWPVSGGCSPGATGWVHGCVRLLRHLQVVWIGRKAGNSQMSLLGLAVLLDVLEDIVRHVCGDIVLSRRKELRLRFISCRK